MKKSHAIQALVIAALLACAATAGTTTWKPFPAAVLRVDDQPPKEWNVYREGKKTENVLLQIGQRYFLIETHERKVLELNGATVQQKGEDISEESKHPKAKTLAISEWNTKDVGPALRITFKLTDEGRVFVLELPQWLNRGVTY